MARKAIGPGPGAYKLPPLTGFLDHDYTKYKNPAYSIKPRGGLAKKNVGPGPAYDTRNFTEHGRETQPAYSIKPRHPDLRKALNVGFLNPTFREGPNPPAYGIRIRAKGFKPNTFPGPDKYMLPTTVGCKVPPDMHAAPCYSLRYRHDLKAVPKSPGPAAYDLINPNIFKTKAPGYSIRIKGKDLKAQVNPGPAAYLPRPVDCPKGLPMGHRSNLEPYILPDDELPCKK